MVRGTRSSLILLLAVILVWSLEQPVQARFGRGASMRTVGRSLNRAVQRQTRTLIKPTLKIRRGRIDSVLGVDLSADDRFLTAILPNGSAALWDLEQGQVIARIRAPGAPIRRAVMATGSASASGRRSKGGPEGGTWMILLDGRGRVWRIDPWKVEGFAAEKPISLHDGRRMISLAVAADGRHVAMGDREGRLRGVEIASGRDPVVITGDRGRDTTAVAVNPDGSLWALGHDNGAISVWERRGRSVRRVFEDEVDDEVRLLRFVGKDRLLVVDEDSEAWVFDWQRGRERANWEAHDDDFAGGAVSGDGRLAVTADEEGRIALWAAATGRRQGTVARTGPEATGVAINRTGQRVFVSAKDGLVRLFSDRGRELARLIVTEEAWAVVDRDGRYDGVARTFEDVAWDAAGTELAIDNFHTDYFEPGVLVKHFRPDEAPPMLTEPPKPVEEGIHLPPEVTLSIAARRGKRVGAPLTLTITARAASDQPPAEIRLLAEGRVVETVAPEKMRITAKKEGMATWTATLTRPAVAGKTRFEAVALSAGNIESNPVSAEITIVAPPPPAIYRVHAVGVNDYQNRRYNLDFAANDAKAVMETLVDRGQEVYDDTVSTLFIDAHAAKDKVVALLEALARTSTHEDVLILFLAGHGKAVDGDWYFLPHHELRSLRNNRHIRQEGLAASEFAELLAKIPARRILMIVDACNSGAAIDQFENFQDRRALSGLKKATGIHILAATRADQLAPEYSILRHGLFSYTLLKAFDLKADGKAMLADEDEDGTVSVGELRRFITAFMPRLAHKLDRMIAEQQGRRGDLAKRTRVTPAGKGLGEDFTIAKQ